MKNEEIIEIHERRDHWIKDVDRKFKIFSNKLKNNLTVLELALSDLTQGLKRDCYFHALSDTRRLIAEDLAFSPHPGSYFPTPFSPDVLLDKIKDELLLLKKKPVITWCVNEPEQLLLRGDPDHFRYVILGIVHHMLINDQEDSPLIGTISIDNYYAKIEFVSTNSHFLGDIQESLDDVQVRLIHSIIQINGGAFLFDKREGHFLATCLWPLSNSMCTMPSHDLGGTHNENNP